jgi:Leucine-rich repeat (LRR) protein
MKQLLLICAVVALVGGCLREVETITEGTKTEPLSPEEKFEPPEEDPLAYGSRGLKGETVEEAIRAEINKPTGELTKADYEKVTHLYLDRNKLTEVPKELAKLTQLKELDLGGNQLTEVPKGLEKLTQLRYLELSANQLTEVPKVLEKLTQLKELNLYSNGLASVKGLEKLTQLKNLTLADNQLTDVKGLEKLTQLKELNLHSNGLASVKGLEKLTQLKELHLSDNPDLTKAQIDQLQKALPECEIYSNPKK